MFNLAKKLLGRLDTSNLPSLDQILLELIDICDDRHATFKDIAEIISKDAAITTKVMTVVNSPVFGQRQRLSNIERALFVLGVDTIKVIAITTSIRQALSQLNANNVLDMRIFWRHSLSCAMFSMSLAKLIDYRSPNEAYLTGLLHDVGRLVLAENFPLEYAHLSSKSSFNMPDLERKQFGFTSCDVGAWLINKWNLHSFMFDAVLYQNEPLDQIQDTHVLVKLIFVAKKLSYGDHENNSTPTETAELLFGLTPALTLQIKKEIDEEVNKIAQSLAIDVSPSETNQKSQNSAAPMILEEGIATHFEKTRAQWQKGQFAERMRDFALIDSIHRLFSYEKNINQLVNAIKQAVHTLFGLKQTQIFQYDERNARVFGNNPVDQDDLINQLWIPYQEGKSIIVDALKGGEPMHSFDSSIVSVLRVIDRQIIQVLGKEGIICLPMIAKKTKVGVLILGIDQEQLGYLEKQLKLMTMFATEAAFALLNYHIESEKRQLDQIKAREVVHEVNTPLNILKNYVVILRTKLGAQNAVNQELNIINEEIDRIGRIIRNLIDSSKPQAEKAIDVNRTIADLIDLCCQSQLIPDIIKVSFVPDKEMPSIVTDQDTLKQSLLNLIKNAVEAMMESGGELKIRTKDEVRLNNKKYIEITVSDKGPGIAETMLGHLFEPGVSTKGDRRGFGLTIVKNLISDLRGMIKCESREQMGASFQILIPRILN